MLRQIAGVAVAGVLIVLATGCMDDPAPGAAAPAPTGAGPGTPATHADPGGPPARSPVPRAGTCPVTLPSSTGPPGVSPAQMFGWGASHGNGQLWVGGLWPGGVIRGKGYTEADGSVSMKFGWWRAAHGQLTITGSRLNAAEPPLRASIPSGYGDTGFQSTAVSFPTEGCWRVTGRVGGTTLSFVTLVVP